MQSLAGAAVCGLSRAGLRLRLRLRGDEQVARIWALSLWVIAAEADGARHGGEEHAHTQC